MFFPEFIAMMLSFIRFIDGMVVGSLPGELSTVHVHDNKKNDTRRGDGDGLS